MMTTLLSVKTVDVFCGSGRVLSSLRKAQITPNSVIRVISTWFWRLDIFNRKPATYKPAELERPGQILLVAL